MNIEFITLDQSNKWQPIATHFGKQLHKAEIVQFADGETCVALDNPEMWHNRHAVIIQTTYPDPQKQILHLAFLAHELKNAGCSQVTAVIPYFGYARQEKSAIAGKSGPAYVIAHTLQRAGVDQVITIEAHTPILKEFFTIPFNSVSLVDTIAQHIKQHIDLSHGASIIAVDKGAHERAQATAKKLNCDLIQFTKERYAHDASKIVSASGTSTKPVAIIVDDIIDTGGSALHVAHALQEQGVQKIFGYFVHPVFSGDALGRIEATIFEKVFVSNTIAMGDVQNHPKIAVFDINNVIIQQITNLIVKKR